MDYLANEVYIIAEIGNNHNGDLSKAFELVDIAKEAGADCVKFQLRSLEHLYRKKTLEFEDADLGTEYILELLKKFELSIDAHEKIYRYVNDVGLDYMCTPWDLNSVDILKQFGVSQYKIASADFTNLQLINKVCETGKPIFLSCGMSNLDEIRKVIQKISSFENSKTLLHCNSTYPAPFEDLNLNFINTLKSFEGFRIGYSGHERGIAASIAAVALGAKVIERHLTLDKDMEGPDHAASLIMEEFKAMSTGIKEVEKSLGLDGEREISQGALMNRENLSKSIVATRKIKAGTLITEEDLSIKSPGFGLSPLYYEDLISKKAVRDINPDDYFYKSDLEGETFDNGLELKFNRPTGVPVRFHDINVIVERFYKTIDHLEFHLSFKDIEKGISEQIKIYDRLNFIVHAPELFNDSLLLDLCAHDENIRKQSVQNMQKTIHITKKLKKYFPNESRPRIVTNIGGFSRDGVLDKKSVVKSIDMLEKSLQELGDEEVEIIPQTMAPYPWHFGGQRFHNLMMSAENINFLCEKFNMQICLDVSHSQLYCNLQQTEISDFIRKVGLYVSHIHLSDTRGTNGEGLQFGDGTSNIASIVQTLNEACPQASFIPEVWQGHKENGSGFEKAFHYLKNLNKGF